MIEFKNIEMIYPDGTNALTRFSLIINKGEFITLIGPSGCGKTTSMKLINRLLKPSSGSIYINNKNIQNYNIHELRWNIGYVLQDIALFPHMTIEQNIATVPELKNWKRNRIRERIDELLNMVDLDPTIYKKRMPDELSGGQQQRIGVARALAADPDIILMDEPFSALDPISRDQLQNDILLLHKKIKKTIVFVTHDMDEALSLGDRVCLMKDGTVNQVDTPQHLVLNPATTFAKEFIGNKKSIWETAVDIIADRSERYLIDQTSFEKGLFNQTGMYVLVDKDRRYLGAVLDGEFTEVKTLKNNMHLYKATEVIQSNEQPLFPVLSKDRLIGIISYKEIVEYFKRHVKVDNGVIYS